MEIVIKISKEVYKQIQSKSTEIQAEGLILENAVLNGTPLPEGHGRLKDVDWIDDNCEHHHSDTDGSWCYAWKDIENAPTIIEADKAESEEISERNMKMWQALFKAESEE